MKHLGKKGVVVACALSVAACASITGGRYQHVEVDTRAAGQSVRAECTLSNGTSDVHVLTPGTAVIHRSSSDLSVVCQKDGKQIAQERYDSYLRKIIWFGGGLGILIDLVDGASHHYPNNITVTLPAAYAEVATYPNGNVVRGATYATPMADGLASLDGRVSKSMFNAAQNVAAARQCDRAIHVVMVDGRRAMFRSQCPASSEVQIECAGDACVPLQQAGIAAN
jgi:hypothetical protein